MGGSSHYEILDTMMDVANGHGRSERNAHCCDKAAKVTRQKTQEALQLQNQTLKSNHDISNDGHRAKLVNFSLVGFVAIFNGN